MTTPAPLLQVRGLSKVFPIKTGMFKQAELTAVNSVDIAIGKGRTLAIVGESGSGKTTLGRLVLRLIEPTAGSIDLDGTDLTSLDGARLRDERGRMQMVFQDPFESLSPWQTVGQTIREPLQLHDDLSKAEVEERVVSILERVGLTAAHGKRYPHQLSGGQQQRVGIARAVVTNPSLVVLDEPTSSLDMSVQSQILQLLKSLQEERDISYLFISHDLTVVRFLADEIAVMYLGRVIESGPVAEVFAKPRHPYTEALLTASPRPDPNRSIERNRLSGEQPSPIGLRAGCPLVGRCPIELDACATMPQSLLPVVEGHNVACWRSVPPADLATDLKAHVLAAEGEAS